MNKLTYLLSGLAIVTLGIIVFTRAGGLDTDRTETLALYGGPPSQCMEIDSAHLAIIAAKA